MRRRSRRKIWIMPLVLIILCLIGILLLRFVFVVRSVEIQGSLGGASQEDVVRAAKIGFGTSIFKVDEDRIERGINGMGVLRLENVEIRYPDTLHISVAARSRDAMILHMGKIRVLDENMCVVESLDRVPDMDLIYVSGLSLQNYATGEQLRAEREQVEAYCAVIQAVRSNAAGVYISELMLSDPENLRIITRTGINVELGDVQNMNNKIAWMKGAVADLEKRGEKGGTLDVRSGSKADYRAA